MALTHQFIDAVVCLDFSPVMTADYINENLWHIRPV